MANQIQARPLLLTTYLVSHLKLVTNQHSHTSCQYLNFQKIVLIMRSNCGNAGASILPIINIYGKHISGMLQLLFSCLISLPKIGKVKLSNGWLRCISSIAFLPMPSAPSMTCSSKTNFKKFMVLTVFPLNNRSLTHCFKAKESKPLMSLISISFLSSFKLNICINLQLRKFTNPLKIYS